MRAFHQATSSFLAIMLISSVGIANSKCRGKVSNKKKTPLIEITVEKIAQSKKEIEAKASEIIREMEANSSELGFTPLSKENLETLKTAIKDHQKESSLDADLEVTSRSNAFFRVFTELRFRYAPTTVLNGRGQGLSITERQMQYFIKRILETKTDSVLFGVKVEIYQSLSKYGVVSNLKFNLALKQLNELAKQMQELSYHELYIERIQSYKNLAKLKSNEEFEARLLQIVREVREISESISYEMNYSIRSGLRIKKMDLEREMEDINNFLQVVGDE